MDIFPTQYSLLSAQAINHQLCQVYGFKATTCKLLVHNISDVYIFEAGGNKYIFKIYRQSHRSLDQIRGEVELLNLLKDQGARIAYPVPDREGKFIQIFNAAEGPRYGVLFSYAPGEIVRDLSDEQLAIVGREMAKIHNVTSGIKLNNPRPVYDIHSLLTQPLADLKSAFETLPDEYAWLVDITQKVITKLRQTDHSKFSYGYCHYDFLPKNFHFTSQNEVAFFDFDLAGEGFLINDITCFYAHLFTRVNSVLISRQQMDERFAIFLRAYRAIRPITEDEIATIPCYGFAFWLFDLALQYNNFEEWSNFFFKPQHIKQSVALTRHWAGEILLWE